VLFSNVFIYAQSRFTSQNIRRLDALFFSLLLAPHVCHRDAYAVKYAHLERASRAKRFSFCPRFGRSIPSRDEKRVTATPLESAFTNRDARNFFRMCFYKKCRVSLEQSFPFLKYYLNLPALDTLIARHPSPFSSFPFTHLRTLTFSVSRKSFVCHSYENCRVYTNNSHSGTEERRRAGWNLLHQTQVTNHQSPTVVSFHPVNIFLNEVECRVLGSLVEKEITTPGYYPLSLNALVNACNQKSNRDPAMNLDEASVRRALHSLDEQSLIRSVSATDSRVTKYEHRLQEAYNFYRHEIAILCVLLLRGPQTPGELRTRAERMHPFDDLSAVQSSLQHLMKREPPLAKLLARQQGTKEARYAHFLSGDVEVLEAKSQAEATPDGVGVDGERITNLEQKVATLQKEIADLKQQFALFRKQFD